MGCRASASACGACVEACVAGAREMAGRRMSVAEVLAEVEKDVVFFDESGGGVTFSGGEPLAQPEFTERCSPPAARRGIHTALDTCGCAAGRNAARASPRLPTWSCTI